MFNGYYRTRFAYDRNRQLVWKEIANYLKKFIPEEGTVLDLGAGYCDFINQIKARKRYALNTSSFLSKYAADGVKFVMGKAGEKLAEFEDVSIDVVFSSNFLEHLKWPEIEEITAQVRRILVYGGRWIIVQPNFKYAYRSYFDDFTHRTIFTETSLSDYLVNASFILEQKVARFLPLSFHSRLPKWPFLVRVYLRLPCRIFARQMLIIVRKEKDVAK